MKEKVKIFYIILFLLSFSIGIFRYEIKDNIKLDKNLEGNIGSYVSLDGVISDEPQIKENNTILVVDLKNIINGTLKTPVSAKSIISTNSYPEFQYGDLIKISGKIKKPENFESSSSSKDFDYVSYLAKDDIFYKIDFAKISLISNDNGSYIKSFLFKLKNSFMNNLSKVIPEPESSLLSGILLGAKTSLNVKVTDMFRVAGVSHIIALSGYNITIVAKAIMDILSFMPRAISASFGILGIIFFVIMSGGTTTAIRAGIMSVIGLVAVMTHRKYSIDRALIIAIFIMVFINPKILVFDISFQLSCLATIAIIYVSPIVKNKINFITNKFGFRDIISTTIAAQILVLPFLLYKMGLLSLVSLPANILILPIIPITMFLGFFTGLFTFVFMPLSMIFAFVSYLLLAYIIKISGFFAGLPFSALNISWFSSGLMFFSYLLIGFWIIKNKNAE